jgi:hypothetical protein
MAAASAPLPGQFLNLNFDLNFDFNLGPNLYLDPISGFPNGHAEVAL